MWVLRENAAETVVSADVEGDECVGVEWAWKRAWGSGACEGP
jgi:hypothetical protein